MPANGANGTNGSSGDVLDVVIVGAGISGINTAYYLQKDGPKNSKYKILERRGRIGGTWDLFQYPGIRSDSDIFTFGFSWNPWKGDRPIAAGTNICSYLSESAAQEGIDKNIKFHHHIMSADWNSKSSTWKITAKVGEDEDEVVYYSRFIVLGTGYYDYDTPMETTIPGIENFQGPVIKPQFWPSDLDYVNKDVTIIGSGATAITLVPSLAEDARNVTMLQRSPTYILPLQSKQFLPFKIIMAMLPTMISSRIKRLNWTILTYFLYYLCRTLPNVGKFIIRAAAKRELPPGFEMDPHFKPRYNPWDQRLCVCPDGDFFTAVRSGKADIVTDVISRVTEDSIELKSGKILRPDVIVQATGLKLSFAGKIKITVDGKVVDPSSKFSFKGAMLQDVPNLAFVIGYANASWTLGAEATGVFLARLWKAMAAKNLTSVTPRTKDASKMREVPQLNLNSTYVKSAQKNLPKGGEGLWAPKKGYWADLWTAGWPPALQGLETR